MLRLHQLVLIALFFASLPGDGEGKICPSIDVRNDPANLEKLRNCTIVAGKLYIVLIEKVNDSSAFDGYSFPELEEVVDHLVVFRVSRLTTLRNLFPNLKLIRGRRRFLDYSLVLFRLPHMQEIGLTSLQHISRGGVHVDQAPNLCYVDSVNWRSLGTSLHYPSGEGGINCKDQSCPNECAGSCWSNSECQKWSKTYCDLYEYGGKCVSSCPKTTVPSHGMMRCLSRQECEAISTWWVFNNTCIDSCPFGYYRNTSVEGGCRYMGDKYVNVCEGNRTVRNFFEMEQVKDCTHITENLVIHISDYSLEPYLEEYLGQVQYVGGHVKIGQSKAIRSLDFLKSLKVIEGETLVYNRYAVFVYENENLQTLWNLTDFRLSLRNGTLGFHENPVLCLSEIEKVKNFLGFVGNVEELSEITNGYKSDCNQKEMTMTLADVTPTSIRLSWKQKTLVDNDTVIGYILYYIKAHKGVVDYDEKTGCDVDSWNSIFVRENSILLSNLVPYTRYIYYIKTYTTLSQEEQTPRYNFVTALTEPSEVRNFTAQALNDTSILLKWKPPVLLNGPLSYYRIYMSIEEDPEELVDQRNYCKYPPIVDLKEEPKELNTSVNVSSLICGCPQKKFIDVVTEDLACTESDIKLGICRIITLDNKRRRMGGLSNDTIEIRLDHEYLPGGTFTQVGADKTSYIFNNLSHYSMYTFYMDACNVGEEIYCGASSMSFARTKRRESADVVENLQVRVDDNNAYVSWSIPEESNSVLVAYNIERNRTDSESSKSISECITRKMYEQDWGKRFKLYPGKYAVRVRAISLGGTGNFSKWAEFEISSGHSSAYKIYLPLLFLLLFTILAVVVGYVWYRRKRGYNSTHLITSINPDYAGPIYQEDEWEIDRNDIEIIRELGQGSFGMVYQGVIKSRRYPCAIKTVNESASMPSRMEFLNEGSVMKTFNDGHHVVRLLGIVSRGQPPLVIMELMERGDLKSYLRRCREPSQNLTTNELYRMAVEIADGMAYLAAKKFVHRDLAARNCMVGADRTVKIGDFGMARDIYETDYYRKETVGLLPVRWMAPESLADGVFTCDSDVWSYGIVLWEMATLAEQPYQGLSNEEVFHFVKNKGRLDRPNECSDLLYEVMDACWMWRPNDRPTFSDIVNKLVDHVGEDFRLVAFCFSKQGRELALNAGPRVYNPPAMLPVAEEDPFGHYDPSEEEVNLYIKDSNRPTKFLPYSNQRMNKSSSYQISPGSPSSTFSFNSS